MYRVVIAVDTEMAEPARLAAAVASLPEAESTAEATVLNVFEEFEVTGAESGKINSDDIYDEEKVPDSVTAVQQHLSKKGVSTTTERRYGEPADEVITAAEDIDADLIVIGGRKRSPVGKALFGSVAQSILLESDRPVMHVRTD
ncbi:universal stress protein (plasmid) [Haloferacaceae archaeon DSL9]